MNMWSISVCSFVYVSQPVFLHFYIIIYFHQSFHGSEGNHTYIINFTLPTHTRTEFCYAALLGLMVMFFMSVPCCGCVSQTERLTNCSILLNVRVTEAINGSELIAVTHLAPCYRVLPFTTCPEDLVLSTCLILDRLFGLCTDEQPLSCAKRHRHPLLCCLFILWTRSSLLCCPC